VGDGSFSYRIKALRVLEYLPQINVKTRSFRDTLEEIRTILKVEEALPGGGVVLEEAKLAALVDDMVRALGDPCADIRLGALDVLEYVVVGKPGQELIIKRDGGDLVPALVRVAAGTPLVLVDRGFFARLEAVRILGRIGKLGDAPI